MLAYFDTSALVPLLIDEPATARCTTTWNAASVVATSSIGYVEVHAALAQARRQRRLTSPEHRRALKGFAIVWEDLVTIPVNETVIGKAATLAATHALRGYDAVHCAASLAVATDDFVAVSGDRALLDAWAPLGIATVDTNA